MLIEKEVLERFGVRNEKYGKFDDSYDQKKLAEHPIQKYCPTDSVPIYQRTLNALRRIVLG